MPVTSVKDMTATYITITHDNGQFTLSSNAAVIDPNLTNSLITAFYAALDYDTPMYAVGLTPEDYNVFRILCEQSKVIEVVDGATETLAKNYA